MKTTLRAGLSTLALCALLTAPALARGKDFEGQQAPDFAIEEMSFGGEQNLSDFAGKVVLLEFWFLG
jgi:hypothetical protein